MTGYPKLSIDLDAVAANTRLLAARLRGAGFTLVGVTKCVDGEPRVGQALREAGCAGLEQRLPDARLAVDALGDAGQGEAVAVQPRGQEPRVLGDDVEVDRQLRVAGHRLSLRGAGRDGRARSCRDVRAALPTSCVRGRGGEPAAGRWMQGRRAAKSQRGEVAVAGVSAARGLCPVGPGAGVLRREGAASRSRATCRPRRRRGGGRGA